MSSQVTPSQTAGPFLAIGLPWPDGPFVVAEGSTGAIVITGTVLDGAGDPLPDALVETWQADPRGRFAHPDDPRGAPAEAGTAGASTAGASTAGASTAGASTAGASTAGASTAVADTPAASTLAAGTPAADTPAAGIPAAVGAPPAVGARPASFRGFSRCATDQSGRYRVVTLRPGPLPCPDGRTEAPHLDVSVFARGLLDRVVTRIYFPDEPEANAADPVLAAITSQRRATLIATAVAAADGPASDWVDSSGIATDRVTQSPRDEPAKEFRFDIRLQGERETVFFDV